MPPLRYWFYRLLRRNTPQAIVDWMLDHGVYLQAGLETSDARAAVDRYERTCHEYGRTLRDARVCVVGYGGGLAVALHLLDLGVKQVILQDPFAPQRPRRNAHLDRERMEHFFHWTGDHWEPRDRRTTIVAEALSVLAERSPHSVDVVLSSSVLEHVSNVDRIALACARLTHPEGINVHFIDLRDHFFKYPFEMLCYSQSTWGRWLNASNNLNRLRLWDHERVWRRHFRQVDVCILDTHPGAFESVRGRVRSEFLSGDSDRDAAGHIRLCALTGAEIRE